MTVRPMRPGDEPAVRALQSHLEYADPDLVTAALDGPFLGLVATADVAVVGYAVALPGSETALSELVVAPEYRRCGYGAALVEAVVDRAASDTLVVTTPASETEVHRFYESLGFAVDERLAGFYADGADALRLVRRE